MKVSIIIPVYNEQDFIEKSIESIINQTTKPQKVIYVNDSSTDKSRSIIEEFSEKYNGLIWLIMNRNSSTCLEVRLLTHLILDLRT